MDEAEKGGHVDEALGEVEKAGAELARRVVLRKRVMIVVEAFAAGQHSHEHVLDRSDAFVIWSDAVEVSGTVDEPGGVQGETVAEHVDEEGAREGLVPHVHRYECGQHEAAEDGERHVELVLPVDDGIGEQIVNGYAFAFLDDVRMLFDEQPAHVSEKEASVGVVRIGIGFAVLVVHAVIA